MGNQSSRHGGDGTNGHGNLTTTTAVAVNSGSGHHLLAEGSTSSSGVSTSFHQDNASGSMEQSPQSQQQQDTQQDSDDTPSLCFVPCDDDWPYVWAMRNWKILDWRKACPTPELLQQVALEQLSLPVEITRHLYLGDADCIANVQQLQSLGITSVLNVATAQTLSHATRQALSKAGIEYAHVATKDEYNYPLLALHWQELYTILRQCTTGRKARCVVHCHAGQNRAGLVVAAYYMVTQQETVLSTVRWLRRQRGNTVLLNHGFQEQLVALARSLDLLGAPPGTVGSIVAAHAPPRTVPWIVPQSLSRAAAKTASDRDKAKTGWIRRQFSGARRKHQQST